MKYSLYQLLLLLVVTLVNGCSSNPAISKEQAANLARQEIIRQGGKDVEVRDARFENDRWTVMVSSVPTIPGGHSRVELTKEGKVIRVVPGK